MRKSLTPAILAAFVAAAASAPALADDNGMTPGYGDSWANLQARNPQAAPVPPTAIEQNAIDPRAAYDRARANMHNMWNRMTGTTTTTTNGRHHAGKRGRRDTVGHGRRDTLGCDRPDTVGRDGRRTCDRR